MFTFTKVARLFLIVVVLVSCTTPQQKVDTRSVRSVAVIAALHEVVALNYTGFTVFDNAHESVPVNWDMSAAALRTAVADLSPRYDVRPINLTPAALQTLVSDVDQSDSETFDGLARRLKSILQPGAADIVLVIGGTFVGNAYVARKVVGSTNVGIVFNIVAFDGSSLKFLSRGYSGREQNETVDLNWRGEAFGSLPEGTKATIRSAALSTLSNSIPAALRRAGMIE